MIDIEQKRRELSYYCLADTMGLLPLDLYAEVESMYSPNFYQWLFDDDTLPPISPNTSPPSTNASSTTSASIPDHNQSSQL